MRYQNFRAAYSDISMLFKRDAISVPPSTWQAADVSKKPEMATRELEDLFFGFPTATMELDYHRKMIGPNLPWADDHFEQDRVSGEPLNPGSTWAQWPYALKADSFRDDKGQFNHSYAERFWPKLAGKTDMGELRGTKYDAGELIISQPLNDPTHFQQYVESQRKIVFDRVRDDTHSGIRYPYGDLGDVVNLLIKNPLTRNAYLPVWSFEDTGVVHGGRTPCTIGYLFRMRENRLSVFYDIRSCDFVRHFKDDVYLTVRLLLWVIEQCRLGDPRWNDVKPGMFQMHIGSFHIFENDWKGVIG